MSLGRLVWLVLAFNISFFKIILSRLVNFVKNVPLCLLLPAPGRSGYHSFRQNLRPLTTGGGVQLVVPLSGSSIPITIHFRNADISLETVAKKK